MRFLPAVSCLGRARRCNDVHCTSSETPALLTKKPATPEMDYSGIVVGGDLGGTDLRIGDEVVGMYPVGSPDTLL